MNIVNFPCMEEIGCRLRRSPHALFALDYDGTLTPIVEDPAEALLAPSLQHVLGELARRNDVSVAVVSGRAAGDLQEMVAIPGVVYAGNHGMEIVGPGIQFTEPGTATLAPVLHTMAHGLAENVRHIPGAVVEDKGLTLSIHYRKVSPVDVEEVWQTVFRTVQLMRDRFHIAYGAKVFEIRPFVRWNKGTAVMWIKEKLAFADALVVYIGDDATDEVAYLAVGDNALTIRVGNSVATTAARYLLPGPAEVHGLLRWALERVQDKLRS